MEWMVRKSVDHACKILKELFEVVREIIRNITLSNNFWKIKDNFIFKKLIIEAWKISGNMIVVRHTVWNEFKYMVILRFTI